jgi:hypothetical protein
MLGIALSTTVQLHGSVQHSISVDSSIGGCGAGCFSTHTTRSMHGHRLVHRRSMQLQCSTVSVLIRASVAAALVVSAHDSIHAQASPCPPQSNCSSVQHSINLIRGIGGC